MHLRPDQIKESDPRFYRNLKMQEFVISEDKQNSDVNVEQATLSVSVLLLQ